MLVTVTVAPGTAAPFGSTTVPLMAPLLVCATTPINEVKMMAITANVRMSLLLQDSIGLAKATGVSSATKDRHWANSRRGTGWNLGIAKQSLAAKEIRFRGG